MKYDVVITFMIVARIFAVTTLVYIVVDLILELLKRKKKQEPEYNVLPKSESRIEPNPEIVVVPPLEPIPMVPVVVDRIDAKQADVLISDELAMKCTKYEEGAGKGKQGIVNIGLINRHFAAGETITLQALKEKKLVPQKIRRLKVLADGILNKPLSFKAEDYSVQAVKMIELTGGTVIIFKN